MSKIQLDANASGTGVFTIASPNSNTNQTFTLPDDSGSVAIYGGNTTETGFFALPSGTTAQRPASPQAGYIRHNTTLEQFEVYADGEWQVLKDTTIISATGGTETTVVSSGVTYNVHTFTSSGTFTVTNGGDFEYLVIAGGGGGGTFSYGSNYGGAGGGGAGGYRSSVTGEATGGGSAAESKITLSAGTYTITVGAGGAGGAVTNNSGSAGNDSSIGTTIVSAGGGAGGGYETNGGSGGSGGGAGGRSNLTGFTPSGGSGTSGQGNDGGDCYYVGGVYAYGGAGGSSNYAPAVADNTNTGITSSINGSATERAKGGFLIAGTSGTASGSAGAANTGNGGGASAYATGAAGGSGLVIIRYVAS